MKTYKELTPVEALKRLAEAGKPIEGLWFSDNKHHLAAWETHKDRLLCAVDISDSEYPFRTVREGVSCLWQHCAELIEEAPKPWTFETAPKGCVLIRNGTGTVWLIISWGRRAVTVAGSLLHYDHLAANPHYEHSLDGGQTWAPCTT